MIASGVAPVTPPSRLIKEVRESCHLARQNSGVNVNEAQIDNFLLNVLPAGPSQEDIESWLTTGFRLPLAYDTVHDEINVLSVLCFLNALSGYRTAFHRALGHGAHKVIVQIVMGLYISDASGSERALSANTLASVTPMNLLTLLNLSTHDESRHESLPAVVVGKRRRDEVYEALETLCVAANNAGQRLQMMRCPDLGTLVEQLLQEAAKEGKTEEERASVFVSKIISAIPAFDDACKFTDGSVVRIHKRAFLLLSWLHAALSKRSESASLPPIPDPKVLPAFIDNVLPSLLVHFGILDLSRANDAALRAWKAKSTSGNDENGQNIVDGPTLSREEAYVVRASALDAIHQMSLRAHDLAQEQDRPWLAQVNESMLDAWLWTQAKRSDLTIVPRMVEKKTYQY